MEESQAYQPGLSTIGQAIDPAYRTRSAKMRERCLGEAKTECSTPPIPHEQKGLTY